MKTTTLKQLRQEITCTNPNCTYSGCNEEYVLLKDAEEECKNLWTAGNNQRAEKMDAFRKLTDANAKVAKLELELKNKSGALDIVSAQRREAWDTTRELRKTVAGLETKVATLKSDLAETQAGILKRDLYRDCYYITGDRWTELHDAERNLKAERQQNNDSQQIIDAQATVIRNQKVELQNMAAELMRAKPFFVVAGVPVVVNANVAPGQIIGISAPETVIYPFEDPYWNLLRKMGDALEAQPGEDIVALAQTMREERNSYKAIVREIRKALGIKDVTPGTDIIALAQRARASNEQLRERNDNQYAQIQRLRSALVSAGTTISNIGNAAESWLKIVPARSHTEEFYHAINVLRDIEHEVVSYSKLQPTTGEVAAANGNNR